jgi:polygalacturonase
MYFRSNRREFVAGAGAALSIAATRLTLANIPSDEAWARAADIAKKVNVPTFPNRIFDITKFGARADGTLNTAAIAKAIAECTKAGGGRVLVPAGTFLTGAIHLRSNVELHVSEGATLKFDTNPSSYPMVFTRWEGMELMNYSPLIYAYQEKNIGITGKGTLDGQASAEHWCGRVPGAARSPTGGSRACRISVRRARSCSRWPRTTCR